MNPISGLSQTEMMIMAIYVITSLISALVAGKAILKKDSIPESKKQLTVILFAVLQFVFFIGLFLMMVYMPLA